MSAARRSTRGPEFMLPTSWSRALPDLVARAASGDDSARAALEEMARQADAYYTLSARRFIYSPGELETAEEVQ